MRNTRNRSEQGIALIMAIFALLLLSAIGLAMMYSSNTETKINSNFRDKQVAVYAAQSGALEARNRIHPVTGDIPVPTGVPSTSSPNVVYIINPMPGETVAPWDPNNKYFDTELCHEHILGLTGTEGVPCSGSSAVPGGNNWYTVYDNSSASYTGGFKLDNPLSYKWTRISLKTNNNTPVAADGSSATTTQVCWNGSAQILLPTGTGSNCQPSGSVIAIDVDNPGTGYSVSSPPTLTIGPPSTGGTQATATAIVTATGSGAVTNITLTDPGSNYTSNPTVTITGVGTGATATATIYPNGAPVDSVSLSNAGTGCYQTAPTVSFAGGGGTGATAHVTLSNTADCVYAWSAGGSCKAKAGDTGIAVTSSGGGGSGFAGTLNFKNGQGNYQNFLVTNPGTGYTGNPDSIILSGCTFSSPTFTLGKRVASIALDDHGAGYTSAPAVVIKNQANDPGTAPTATATIGTVSSDAGKIKSIVLTASGTGYTVAPLVTILGGGGTGATATATVGQTGKITGITITNGGSGYLVDPPVTISGGGGSGAQLKASISAGGNSYGQVFLITSMAETASGSRALTQMEAASSIAAFNMTGALTLTGDNPTFGAPDSNNFFIKGNDANSCGETAVTAKPAISVYNDDAVSAISGMIPGGRDDHYTGTGTIPNVVNSSAAAGDAMSSPEGIESLANAIAAMPETNTYGANPTGFDLGTAANPQFSVVNGDLSLTGNQTGYGVLVIRNGNLTLGGNFSWNGVIFVIGNATIEANGGGNGQVNGSMFVSKTKDGTGGMLTTLGDANLDWSGGGTNGIQYDHCWVENLLQRVPFVPISTKPLRILSTRTVTY